MNEAFDTRRMLELARPSSHGEGEDPAAYTARMWDNQRREATSRESIYRSGISQYSQINQNQIWGISSQSGYTSQQTFDQYSQPQSQQTLYYPNYYHQSNYPASTINYSPSHTAGYIGQYPAAPAHSYQSSTPSSPQSNHEGLPPFSRNAISSISRPATTMGFKEDSPNTTSSRSSSPPVHELTNTGVPNIVKMPVPGTFIPAPLLNRGHKPRTDETPFACTKCVTTSYFSNNFDLARHIERIHESQGYNSYRCLVCEQRYARLDGARKHLKKSCKPENKEKNARKWAEQGYQFD